MFTQYLVNKTMLGPYLDYLWAIFSLGLDPDYIELSNFQDFDNLVPGIWPLSVTVFK